MDDNEFWDILGRLDWEQVGDDDAVLAPAVQYLGEKTNEDIFRFEEKLAQKLHALDTKAHASQIGDDAYVNEDEYFSVDCFLYARCVVVSNGKDLFEQVLEDPFAFPKDLEFEAILSLAQQAYEVKNDSDWDYVSSTDYETFKNVDGWK